MAVDFEANSGELKKFAYSSNCLTEIKQINYEESNEITTMAPRNEY